MDADRIAATGDSGSYDRDEDACNGAGRFRKHNCNDAGYRYDLSRGWDAGERHRNRELAGVYDRDRPGGAERDDVGDDYERSFEPAIGSEFRFHADRDLLHGGVSPG